MNQETDLLIQIMARVELMSGYAHQIERDSYQGHVAAGSSQGRVYTDWAETRAQLILQLGMEIEELINVDSSEYVDVLKKIRERIT